jgi:flavin reductase (DIM6/NTAB) family NADH-FMN oxidoreductase RutF/DNA-binding IclR family transcriptional regulator
MGQYPTGVCIVTAIDPDGRPVGMTIGSFNSVSLDPPLIGFMPSRTSSSWNQLRACGTQFCVNILSEGQEETGRLIATRKTDKFAGLEWHRSPAGLPILADSCAYVDCTIEQIHAAGDHDIVVGRVSSLDVVRPIMPMLFFRGGYGSFTPLTMSAREADLVEQLRLVDVVKPVMENLADRLQSEVTVITRVERELVVIATVGRAPTAVVPTRVGQRVPFMPPLGGVHAAWAEPGEREAWLSRLGPDVDPVEHRAMLDVIRTRGYSFGLGHDANAALEVAITPGSGGNGVAAAVRSVLPLYNPRYLDATARHEFHSATAPVLAGRRGLVFTFTLFGPAGRVGVDVVSRYVRELLAATARASELVEREVEE